RGRAVERGEEVWGYGGVFGVALVRRISVFIILFHRLPHVALARPLHTPSDARAPPHDKLDKCVYHILGALSVGWE
ncbi:hypothetical protein V495_02169, partial [Pseudogymnoascus sp. VKM F-4514 (FW-929)]